MKKIVKTFLVVFMIVLLVIPKSLAVEIGAMLTSENTNPDLVTDDSDVTADLDTNVPSTNTDVELKKEETNADAGATTPDTDVEENGSSDVDVDVSDTETNTDVNENNSDTNVENKIDNSETAEEINDSILDDEINVYAEENTYSLTNSVSGMQKINNVWRMLENGKVNYTYTGIGVNDYGTWYLENGEINFKFTGAYRDKNGDTWAITEGKVETEAELVKVDNVWRKVENGKINYAYRGIGTNPYGTWYFENGEINFDFTDTYYEGDKAYIVEEGHVYETVASDMSGMLKVNNTIWRMLENGKVNYTYTGIGTNPYGTWYLKNGEINFGFTGVYKDKNGNAWAVTEGKVELEAELVKINGIWRKIENGKINYAYRGIGTNPYGTWYFENGEINFDFTDTYYEGDKAYIVEEGKVYDTVASDMTGMLKVNNTTWRMLENGKVNYTYTGIGTNDFGTWYLKNGEINFDFTGAYKDQNGETWVVTEGKVESEAELVKIDNVWRKVENGKINYTYTGIGTNPYGTWYFENGEINFDFTDTYYEGDKAYIVEEGHVYETVSSNMSGMLKVNNTIWRMLENGKVNYTYTGIGTNPYGTWYLENGEINFDFTDTYYEGDKAYIVENGKVYKIIEGSTNKVTKIIAKKMDQANPYYCAENNVVGTIVASNANGDDLTSRVTNLSCDVTGSYSEEGITDANSGVTVKVELNRNTGKYEIKLNTAYPGSYTITPNATGDMVSTTLEKGSITVTVEDRTTVNKIKLVDKTTGEELKNNTLELYSDTNNNFGIRIEFYHSYENTGRDVLLSKTAEEITFNKSGDIFNGSTSLCDASESPATGKNKVEKLYIAVTEVSEQKEGKITIKVEDGEAQLTVIVKPVKIKGLEVNGGKTEIELPIVSGGELEIPIELLDELDRPKTITTDMIKKSPNLSASGNIAIYLANPSYSIKTAGYLSITPKQDANGSVTSLVFKLSASALKNPKEYFSEGIVFEFDSSSTETGRDKIILMPTNLE